MTDYGTTGYASGSTSSPLEEESSPSATERAKSAAGAAASEASGVATTAVEQTKAVASTAADQTKAVADDAKQRARRLGQEAKTQLRGQVDEQASRVSRNLGDIGQQLRTMADKTDDPDSPVSAYTRQAGETVQRLASRLDEGGLDQVVDDVKRFARNRPGLFLLGALGAGFVIGRLIKAVDLGEVVKGDGTTGEGSAQGALDAGTEWDRTDERLGYSQVDQYASLSSGPETAYSSGTAGTYDTSSGYSTGGTGYSTESTGYPAEGSQPAPATYPTTPPESPAEGAWGQS
jgi:hypothetical protein